MQQALVKHVVTVATHYRLTVTLALARKLQSASTPTAITIVPDQKQ
jgi:hypothetical protein